MEVREAYNAWAARYDTDLNLTRDLGQRVTREMLAGVGARAVVELGCGTGKNTQFLAAIGAHVYALDFAEGMIRQAQARVLRTNARFILADLTRPWPCADQATDLLVCSLVLEHVADLGFVFEEAARCLTRPGRFFVCELHPFRQYLGVKARLEHAGERVEVPAFVHHISAFLDAATAAGLVLVSLQEWWHEEDGQAPPRLVSFLFEK